MTLGAELNAAIVGLGWWGKILVESVQGLGAGFRFVSAVTKDAAGSASFAARHGLALAGTLDEVLADPAVDAVVLATPHSLHVEQIVAAAAAGKSVFCEKPLALTLAGARRAVGACERAGVTLGLGTDKRFLPAVRELKRLVDAGALGTILHAEAQYSNDNSSKQLSGAWRHSDKEAPGGGMTGPGLHALDGLIHLAGPVARVDAQLHRVEPPPRPIDAVAGLLRFASGATGAFVTVRAVPDCFRLQVHGTRGSAEVTGFDTLTLSPAGAARERQVYDSAPAVGYLLGRFAAAVSGGAAFPVSTRSMLDTVAAFEATIDSLASGRPVPVATVATDYASVRVKQP